MGTRSVRILAAVVLAVTAAEAGARQPDAAAAPAPPGVASLRMRGGVNPPDGTVTGVGLEGVSIDLAVGRSITLSWDRVAEVKGDLAHDAATYSGTAEKLWRATSRLERGDLVSAEPLFEELYQLYTGGDGATTRVIAAGLLRCRIGRGAMTSGVMPWITWQRSASGEASAATESSLVTSGAGGVPLIDAATLLAPGMPPVWVGVGAVQSLARQTWPATPMSDLYEQAARFEAGMKASLPARRTDVAPGPASSGYSFVYAIVGARIGGESERSEARSDLRKRYDSLPEWGKAWATAAIGRSLLRESDPDQKRLGIAELLRLPAEMPRVNAYLTGIAMGEAAVALSETGDRAGAVKVKAELIERFPGHPALDWEPVRGIQLPAPKTEENQTRAEGRASGDARNGDHT